MCFILSFLLFVGPLRDRQYGAGEGKNELLGERSLIRSLYEVSSNSTAVKGYRGKAIYILDDGVKHLIPDWITFLRYPFEFPTISRKS